MSDSRRSRRLLAFALGCLLGAVCFILVYGVKILDPTYDAWLFSGDMDLRQHYIGFCHFRQSSFRFPIGLIETLSYPMSMSVIYTDSIPLFAVIFKLFSSVLPVRFQYFGIYGLLSFILNGGASSLVLWRFFGEGEAYSDSLTVDERGIFNYIVCALCSVFFILSFPVLQRNFYHTALASHWIIFFSLALWLYREELSLKSRVILWGIMGFICVSIHSYFLPMAGMILVCDGADGFFRDHREKGIWGSLCGWVYELLSFCLTALFFLYIYGGFYGEAQAFGEGLGTFSSNLNTFINPLDQGRILKELPLYYDFQYEGFGYLGAGILIFFLTALFFILFKRYKMKRRGKMPGKKGGGPYFTLLFKTEYRGVIALFLFFVSFALAVFPIVAFNDKKVFGVPYPGFVRAVLGIFRSNGRFVWVPVYLLMLFAITVSVRSLKAVRIKKPGVKKGIILSFLILGLLIQLYDISGTLIKKHNYFANEQTCDNIWLKEGQALDPVAHIGDYKGFVFLYNENDIIMDTAYFAYLNGMWQNNYYYARDIDEAVEKNIESQRSSLKKGIAEEDVIYIYKEEDGDIFDDVLSSWELSGHRIGVKKK